MRCRRAGLGAICPLPLPAGQPAVLAAAGPGPGPGRPGDRHPGKQAAQQPGAAGRPPPPPRGAVGPWHQPAGSPRPGQPGRAGIQDADEPARRLVVCLHRTLGRPVSRHGHPRATPHRDQQRGRYARAAPAGAGLPATACRSAAPRGRAAGGTAGSVHRLALYRQAAGPAAGRRRPVARRTARLSAGHCRGRPVDGTVSPGCIGSARCWHSARRACWPRPT